MSRTVKDNMDRLQDYINSMQVAVDKAYHGSTVEDDYFFEKLTNMALVLGYTLVTVKHLDHCDKCNGELTLDESFTSESGNKRLVCYDCSIDYYVDANNNPLGDYQHEDPATLPAPLDSVTEDDVDAWVGNHGYGDKRDEWMLNTLTEIAQGIFTAKQLKDNVNHLKG